MWAVTINCELILPYYVINNGENLGNKNDTIMKADTDESF